MLLCECLRNRGIDSDIITDQEFRRVLFDDLDHKYHLVITDLFMDDLTGVEVLNWVKRVYPDMPVLAFSADPRLGLGKFDGYLYKPVVCPTILSEVAQHIA